MALSRTLNRSLTCSDCQQWVLRTFVCGVVGQGSIISRSLQPHRRPFSNYSRRAIQSPLHEPFVRRNDHQTFSSSQTAVEKTISVEEGTIEPNSETNVNDEPRPPPSQSATSQADLPWYLQVQNAEPPASESSNPLLARQRLPDLPSNPPNLLQPLLEYISTDLGFDDLTILDLRALDPPPALGANLLMVIGTARSEKHLHVSADRLCRWLRTEYKLRPHADGLLGRNELKIQMRRKARRARLLSSAVVGAQSTGEGEIEDGIRTGWVCVNVGRVEGGDLPMTEERVQRAEGIVGFGARLEGYSSIVVQMLTEDKRGEVDLEKLWLGILKRAQRDQDVEVHDGD